MTQQQFIGNYLQKKLSRNKLPYGLAYLNKVARMEEEAAKEWKKLNKKTK